MPPTDDAPANVLLAPDHAESFQCESAGGVRTETAHLAVQEFLDFFRRHGPAARYLAFDSRFTTYAHLARLDSDGVLFVTVRRRGKRLVESALASDRSARRQVRVPLDRGTRLVEACDFRATPRNYGGELRQITILRSRHRRPSLLLTNDFDSSVAEILRRYARRWLVEKSIAEQLAFFRLNRLSSSMVIKVDFDLAMIVLAYNLYRLLALELPPGYRCLTTCPLCSRLCQQAKPCASRGWATDGSYSAVPRDPERPCQALSTSCRISVIEFRENQCRMPIPCHKT